MRFGIAYHEKDMDGFFSAAVVKIFLQLIYSGPSFVFFPMDYGKTFDVDAACRLSGLYMVDFSLPVGQMGEIFAKMGKRFVWIDHHANKIGEVESVVPGIRGLRRDGYAACELAWEYMSRRRLDLRTRKMLARDKMDVRVLPEAVRLIGRYDVWDHRDPDVVPFQLGVWSEIPDQSVFPCPPLQSDTFGEFRWFEQYFFGNPRTVAKVVAETVKKGRAIQSYAEQQNRAYARKYAFDAILRTPSGEEFQVIAMNKGMAGTPSFDGVFDSQRHAFMVAFAFEGGKWGVSLRSVGEMDVARIARQFGGNGHKNAAGCGIDDIFAVLRRV